MVVAFGSSVDPAALADDLLSAIGEADRRKQRSGSTKLFDLPSSMPTAFCQPRSARAARSTGRAATVQRSFSTLSFSLQPRGGRSSALALDHCPVDLARHLSSSTAFSRPFLGTSSTVLELLTAGILTLRPVSGRQERLRARWLSCALPRSSISVP